jgi:hypothetical protein
MAMKRMLIGAVLLAVAGCQFDTTPEQKRWRSLSGDEVYVTTGYSNTVHANKACPDLANPKGDVKVCRVKSGRLVLPDETYLGSDRERFPLCPSCVK